MIYLIFAACLVLTILIEGAAILIWFRRRDFVYYSLLCNLLTNPALNLLLFCAVRYFHAPYFGALLALEIAAVLIESLVYARLCPLPYRRALFVSFALNLLSCGAGLLI